MITKMKKLSFLIHSKEYEGFLEHLRSLGIVHVIRKQQGAESCVKYLKMLFSSVEKLDRSGGFWVLEAKKA